jgi:hypothetical protein
MVTAATVEMRVDPIAGLHDEEAAGDMQQEDALALALLNDDEAGGGEDATTAARRLRPLYPPGQYPLHESICDIWYRCCTWCTRLKCTRLCWKLTCRLCANWLAKESAYLAASPRIVHAFVASCLAAVILAIITGCAGGEWTDGWKVKRLNCTVNGHSELTHGWCLCWQSLRHASLSLRPEIRQRNKPCKQSSRRLVEALGESVIR